MDAGPAQAEPVFQRSQTEAAFESRNIPTLEMGRNDGEFLSEHLSLLVGLRIVRTNSGKGNICVILRSAGVSGSRGQQRDHMNAGSTFSSDPLARLSAGSPSRSNQAYRTGKTIKV